MSRFVAIHNTQHDERPNDTLIKQVSETPTAPTGTPAVTLTSDQHPGDSPPS